MALDSSRACRGRIRNYNGQESEVLLVRIIMQEKVYILKTAQDTFQLGATVGGQLRYEPALVFLSGDLGAGKTTFAQGLIGSFLPEKTPVLSPTYSYVQAYHGLLPIYHFDLYRIEDVASIFGLGLHEQIADENALRLIEWPERLENFVRTPDLHVMLTTLSTGRNAMIKYFEPFSAIP